MPRILSVSYDVALLDTRQKILSSKPGNVVTSARGMAEALKLCNSSERIDLFVLGHSIPHSEKEALVQAFRANHPAAQVIALKRVGEEMVHGADLFIEPNPHELLKSVAKLFSANGTSG